MRNIPSLKEIQERRQKEEAEELEKQKAIIPIAKPIVMPSLSKQVTIHQMMATLHLPNPTADIMSRGEAKATLATFHLPNPNSLPPNKKIVHPPVAQSNLCPACGKPILKYQRVKVRAHKIVHTTRPGYHYGEACPNCGILIHESLTH